MTDFDIYEHIAWFKAYFFAKRQEELIDPEPMDLKSKHTYRVLSNAKRIVLGEQFQGAIGRAALIAALYHDLGRFEQYLRYRTFKDRDSVDHGDLSHEILLKTQCLKNEESWIIETALTAVKLHNKFTLPANLPKDVKIVCQVVRDADKLDILRVIDQHLSTKPYNPTVVLSLPDRQDIDNQVVIQAALNDKLVSYADLKCVNDFRLLLGMWLNDMNFPSSSKTFISQKHAQNIVGNLPISGPYAQARAYVLSKLKI